MVKDSITLNLVYKLNPIMFQVINKDVLPPSTQPLSSSHSSVKRMVTNYSDMLKLLMPTLINTMPSDVKWYDKVSNYWHSFSRSIDAGGLLLEVGLVYDLGNFDRRVFIQELVDKTSIEKEGKRVPTITTSEQLRDYVKKNIPELERYRYAEPINVLDYLTWVFALGHREVANNPQDSTKSTNIRFALIDPRVIEDIRNKNHTVSIEATRLYLEVLSKRDLVRDILFTIGENPDAYKDQTVDADIKLKNIADSSPTKFIELCKDKTLNLKGRIERYIVSGVLRRLPASSIIIDAQDASIVVGNTVDEAVVYLSSEAPDRIAKCKEFSARYNLIKNQIKS